MSGSRMFIYKQNPSVTTFRLDYIFIHTPVRSGPRDDLLNIADMPDIEPDRYGDFLIPPELELDRADCSEEDAIHTFSVCRLVLTMYARAFQRLNILPEEDKNEEGLFAFREKWGKRLDVYIRARKNSLRAFFTSGKITIFLGHKEGIFTCRCFDIIAHEMGHAVLDAMKKGQIKSKNSPEGDALEEAFCDLTVVFAFLSQMDMCNLLIWLSKGNMRSPKDYLYVYGIAEELGWQKFKELALRDLSKLHRLEEVRAREKYSCYDLSLVFSSAVYRFLVGIYESHHCMDKHDPAATLFEFNKMLTDVSLGAFYRALRKPTLDFQSVGMEMIQLLEELKYQNIYGCGEDKMELADQLRATFREHQIFK